MQRKNKLKVIRKIMRNCIDRMPEKSACINHHRGGRKTMFTGKKVAIIGGGKMGSILVRGMVTRKILSAQNITVTDIDPARLGDLRASLKVQVTGDN